MSRTVNPSPRHLDDPPKLGPFTALQWAALVLALVLVWPIFTYATGIPTIWRVVICATMVGVAIGFTGTGGGPSIVDLTRRAWHSLATPSEYLSGPPRRGPLTFALYDDEPHQEEARDA